MVGWVGQDAMFEFDSVADALDEARQWAAAAPRRAVVVTGSITLVAEAMEYAADRDWMTS